MYLLRGCVSVSLIKLCISTECTSRLSDLYMHEVNVSLLHTSCNFDQTKVSKINKLIARACASSQQFYYICNISDKNRAFVT